MKWYWLSCEQCGWKAQQPVDERVMEKFRKVRYCQQCKKDKKPNREFTIRETITSTRSGK